MTDTRQARANRGNRIALGVLIAVVSLFCFLSDVGALGGVGRMVYSFLVGFFGLASYAYSIMGLIAGVAIIFGVRVKQRPLRSLYYFGLLLIGIFALHIYTSSPHIIGAGYGEYLLNCYHETNTAGGMLFGLLAFPLMKLITGVGALTVACAAFLVLAGVGIFPSIRRNVTYTAVSQQDRRREERAGKKKRAPRGAQDPVVGADAPVITDFSDAKNGAKLFILDVEGDKSARGSRRKKGAEGYTSIDKFDPLYPNKNGGYEDERRVPAPPVTYTQPAPEQQTYAPISDPVREILFGNGPTEENIRRYEQLKSGGMLSGRDISDATSSPSTRRQEMQDKLSMGDNARMEFIDRHRAEPVGDNNADPTDFENIKKDSIERMREQSKRGGPLFEGNAYSAPKSDDVLRAAPEQAEMPPSDSSEQAPQQAERPDREGNREVVKPTRQIRSDGGYTSTVGAAIGATSNQNVNTGMLGAVNRARTGEQPAPPAAREVTEAESEAYQQPKTQKPAAQVARSPYAQEGAPQQQSSSLGAVIYTPMTGDRLPKAVERTAIDQTPKKATEQAPASAPNRPVSAPTEPVSSRPAESARPANNTPLAPVEQRRVTPIQPVRQNTAATDGKPIDTGMPSEPAPVRKPIVAGPMSGAQIQATTDIAHMSGRTREQEEINARISNIKKTNEQFNFEDSNRGEKVKSGKAKGQDFIFGGNTVQPRIDKIIDEAEAAEKPKRPYVKPPISLLNPPTAAVEQNEDYEAKKAQLVDILSFFDIESSVVNVQVGPTFTMYKLHVTMKKGKSVSAITSYANDIAMKMEVESVRILAPIPGMNAVGIEVPNKVRRTVNLSEILQSSNFNDAVSPASFAIGVDLYGDCFVEQIAPLPHLLIAGATGAGKSCGINALIVSLLYKASPDDVRFILVDPKRVELSVYAGIPHLLMDEIICDTDKAIRALTWAEQEMDRRTKLFQSMGNYRNIDDYNNDCARHGGNKIPRIIIIIDEFADLMTTGKKTVEVSIGRLASLARAVGIHLVLATQRPSVDVIPGTIRNNIPARIAFKVTDSGSSKTILDTVGAEALLGKGDLLYMAPSKSDFKRMQGAFISNQEVQRVVDFVKENNDATFDEKVKAEIFNDKPANDKKSDAAPKEEVDRDLEDIIKALQIGIDLRETDGNSFSTSYIQRKLGFGYQKAARLVDKIKDSGYLATSPMDNKKTIVTITREELEELSASLGHKDDEEE